LETRSIVRPFSAKLGDADTFVQLVVVARPSPAKAKQFREIDFKSCEESVAAAVANGVRHLVYVSVADAGVPGGAISVRGDDRAGD
jgi:hypothetical protein